VEIFLHPPSSCHFRQAIEVLVGGAKQSLPMFEFDWDTGIDAKGAWARVLSDAFAYEDANQFVAVAPRFKLAPIMAIFALACQAPRQPP
jgi:hypothetical protein